MADTQLKEEREAAWWKAWREEDFSWEGLARKHWHGWVIVSRDDGEYAVVADTGRVYGGLEPEVPARAEGRKATVQDYWRADPVTGRLRPDAAMAGEFVVVDGKRTYHTVHLPLAYEDGSETGKADWSIEVLDELIGLRKSAATETAFGGERDFREPVGADGRAQFQGGVWFRAKGNLGRHSVRYDFAKFIGDAEFERSSFLGDVSFNNAFFAGRSNFHNVKFLGESSFTAATFSADAFFNKSTFAGKADFDRAYFLGNAGFENVTFSEYASFVIASVSGDADFGGARFQEYASFNKVTFLGEVCFSRAKFSAGIRFNGAEVGGVARFGGVSCTKHFFAEYVRFSSDADFGSSEFQGEVRFDSSTFAGDTDFQYATFAGDISFQHATFSGTARFSESNISGESHFAGTTFSEDVHFNRAKFTGNTIFSDVNFRGKVSFSEGVCHRRISLQRSTFAGLVWFKEFSFCGPMDFTAAVFDKLVSFKNIKWPQDCRHWHGAFDQALFRGTLNLYGAGFRSFAAFDGATLERGIQLDETDEAAARKTFRSELNQAVEASTVDGEDFKSGKSVSKREIAGHTKQQREHRLRELERGCRVLKLAMEQASHKSREQLLYRFELQARRAQKRLPPGEKTFSYLYSWVSDYGASMVRPFIALFLMMAVFAAGFVGWDFAVDPQPVSDGWFARAVQAADLSWGNVFKPLSALSTENDFKDKNALAFRLLYDEEGGVDLYGFGIRAVSTVQSLFAIVLAFLLALAVRRRFQIS
ncbi:MAG: pentapeptide repeat-containing protein [Hyphomonas sp.]|uniref:pentapeptide repeat-containing protein n=1 Tax=Hyphomonas sp. TaxID=87 RepID=UPI003526D28B